MRSLLLIMEADAFVGAKCLLRASVWRSISVPTPSVMLRTIKHSCCCCYSGFAGEQTRCQDYNWFLPAVLLAGELSITASWGTGITVVQNRVPLVFLRLS